MTDNPHIKSLKGTLEGREDSHHKHPLFAVRLEFEDGNVESVMYGTLIGSPYFNPSKGIQFVFEAAKPLAWDKWRLGKWTVSIVGNNLKDIFNHLCESKEVFVKVGESVTAIEIQEGNVEAPEGR